MNLIQCNKYHQYFNHEYKKITGLSLFKYYLKLSITHQSDKNLLPIFFTEIIMYLLEELESECLIEEIDGILILGGDKTFPKKLNIDYNVDDETLFKSKFYVDDLLCMMVGRLKSNYLQKGELNQKFQVLKECLKDLKHPIFKLMFMIIEKKQCEFIENFKTIMLEAEEFSKKKYEIQGNTSAYLSPFLFSMVISATIHNGRKILDKIFESENFAAVMIAFPKNVNACECSSYTALKLLETRYGNMLNDEDIPKNWLNTKDFEEFLNSRIKKTNDGEHIEIDTTFLLHSHTSRFSVKSKHDLNDRLMFWDDTEALEYVEGNEKLKEFITHPVIAAYVTLKWFKYERIYFWNFFILFIQLIAYASYAILSECSDTEDNKPKWCKTPRVASQRLKNVVHYTVIYMVLREIFQFFKFKGWKCFKHFRNFMNVFEISLIFLIIISFSCEEKKIVFPFLTCYFIKCGIIILMVVMLATMFPYSSMYFHMQLFKKVVITFGKFLLTFIFLLFSYVLVFIILFDLTTKNIGEVKQNSTCISSVGGEMHNLTCTKEKNNIPTNVNETEKDPDFFKNFNSIGNGTVAIIMMLSGQLTIEPFKLNIYQFFFFFSFVLISYNLFNLMNALAIDDVTKLKEEANLVVLTKEIKRIIKANSVFTDFYSYCHKDK